VLRTPSRDWALVAVPFVLLIAVGLLRLVLGPGHGLLPLLALCPASAAIVGGGVYTLAVGGVAVGEEVLVAFAFEPPARPEQALVAFVAIAGVTTGGALASNVRRRRERELTEVRAVADVTQRVLLRPVPGRVGSVRLAALYLSASTRARVGGDLYAAVPTALGTRLIIGDAEGKGLSAVQEAATAMGAFRVAAHEESTLGAIVARIEATLDHELGDEQFITAVLAEVSPDGSKMEMINCGHPQPLQLGPRGPQFLGREEGSLPLGLGLPGTTSRIPFTIPLRVGEPVLLYTDGLSEARNQAGEFFPLTECASVQAPADPPILLERLSAEVSRYVGRQPHDDMALLLVERTGP
jgi:serine phosphatase RsbU (regulator of sigma subunit)